KVVKKIAVSYNDATYNIWISSCKTTDEASKIVTEMKNAGFEIDKFTIGALLKVCRRERNNVKSLEFYQFAQTQKIELTSISICTLIHLNPDKALKIYESS